METTKQEQPVADQDKFVRGLYRNIGELARNVKLLAIALERSFGPIKVEVKDETPVQADLPGIAQQDTADLPSGLRWVNEPGVAYKPGDIAKQIAKKPRTWCNTVKVYEYLAGSFAGSFTLNDMIHREAEISARTKGKIGIASYSRIISTLKRAGAIYRTGRNSYIPLMPTDELRETVERVAKKRKEVAA